MNDQRPNKIFLSYSFNDKQKAFQIAKALLDAGLDMTVDSSQFAAGRPIFDSIKYLMQSSDFIVILLSKSLLDSLEFSLEYLKEITTTSRQRKVTVIPVLIERCNIPSDFLGQEIFNLIDDFDRGLMELVNRIRVLPEITFSDFTTTSFEDLIFDFLNDYGFSDIERRSIFNGKPVDFVANYISSNPFGEQLKETWIIEVKFYAQSRFNLKSVDEIIKLNSTSNMQDINILLITNSQLTSVVEEYLTHLKSSMSTRINVIDGLQLKRLIAKKTSLLNKYFIK